MPSQVSVEVVVKDATAKGQLSSLEQTINDLNKKKITIPVNIGGGSGSGSGGGLGNAKKQLQDVATVAKQAGVDINTLGQKIKSTYTVINGQNVEIAASFRKTGGIITEVSSSTGVKVKNDYDAMSRAIDKAAKSQDKYTAAVKRNRDSAVAAGNAYIADMKKQEAELAASEKAQSTAMLKRVGQIGTAMAVAFTIKNVKEALGTMKEVDSELANIRKVTDETAESIQKLGRQAYSTASKYGVSAKEYLTGAGSFAKAGYGNYGDLAELAIKTQLVGDVSAEIADKFLLSADAAYKFGGNVEQLTTVLDRANVIENNYATSIEKIAEGFPIVASTASMANMSIDELMAGLGTITAVTQETGRKAATALRALILNIEGEIGTVIDEDMTITQESVESMADALKKYGNEAVKAAQKTGKLVDPMEAIKSLAEAYKQGDLTDQGLYDILSSLGGKLRTNQLTAIVQNFDMFSEMLERVKSSAGSADKEVDVMLDTWQAKTEQLKNSWTLLVSDLIDSDSFKIVLSELNNFVVAVDKILSRDSVGSAKSERDSVFQEYEKYFGENGVYSNEIKTLKEHSESLTDFDQRRLTYLQEQEKVMLQQIRDANELEGKEASSFATATMGRGLGITSPTKAQLELLNFSNAFNEIIKEDGSRNRQQISKDLDSLLAEYKDFYDTMNKIPYWDIKDNKAASEFIRLYSEALDEQERASKEAQEELKRFAQSAQEVAESESTVAASFENTTTSIEAATKALEEFNNAASGNKESAAQGYGTAYKQFFEDWKSGKNDTNAVNAAFDLFFTPEMQRSMGYNMQAMGELLASDLYQGIFKGTTGETGVDFANYIKDHMTETLSEIAKITNNADGTFNFEYASAEKLAEYFQLPLPAIQALLSALDNYGVEVEMGWEDTQNLADSLKTIGVNADGTGDSIESVADGLVKLGNTDAKKISSMISELAKIGFIKGFENLTPEQIGNAINNALSGESNEVPEIPVDVKVNPEQAQEAVQSAVGGVTSGSENAEVTISIAASGDIESVKNALETVPGMKSVTVTEEGAVEATMEVQALEEAIDSVEGKDVSVVAYTAGEGRLEYLKNLIDTITSKTVTINIPTTGGGSSGGSGGGRPGEDNYSPVAEGTKNARGGKALVNELGPELISDNGRAYIANGGKPAIVELGRGAIVLTAEETRNAFNSGKGSGIRAAASGIPSTGGGASSGGGGAIEYFEDEDTAVAVAVGEPADMSERRDWLEKFLKQIDENIKYQHNLKHHDSEANHYIQLAIDSIKQVRDEYIRNGYALDSQEVAELANQIFEYEKDLQDAKSHAIEDLEDELDNLDARIKLAENQNDVQRALELEQEAQRKIAELIQRYREAGFSDTSDEILSLVNMGYKYSGESESRLKAMREDLLNTIKAIQKNQEEEDDLAEKQKAVQEGRDALQNAQNQRTVRVFNPVTGQWEWVANASDIKTAEENLANAEKALAKEQQSRELAALEKALEKGLGLESIAIGPALAAMISHSSLEQQADLTQALGMLTGGVSATADTSAKSIFDSVDSHDVINQFYFEGLSIGAEIAGVTTLAELANLLVGPLAITDNMPG